MSTVQRAYKTELDLNDRQVTACRQHAGAARWAYNWGLARKQEEYRATGKSPSAIELHRELNALKPTNLPWMYDVSKCAPQEALRNLDSAFAHFFRRVKLQKEGKLRGKLGYPQRKTRKRGLGSFRLTGSIVVLSTAIQLPRLGRLRLKERGYLPTDAKVLSATVRESGGHWYVSVLVEQEYIIAANSGPVVGVDLGSRRWRPSRTAQVSRIRAICARVSRSSSGCNAPSHASKKAVAIVARRRSASAGCTGR
jgi:transposase